ncbi:MAG: L-rhamnose mutarotase, partial [Pyrinomonadaceae bacterium]
MIRKAFLMSLKPGNRDEYERRHNPIWPELAAVLTQHGAHNYSIFLDAATNQLFGYVEIESEELWAQVATTEVCRRWWAHMKDLMDTNADDSPVAVG